MTLCLYFKHDQCKWPINHTANGTMNTTKVHILLSLFLSYKNSVHSGLISTQIAHYLGNLANFCSFVCLWRANCAIYLVSNCSNSCFIMLIYYINKCEKNKTLFMNKFQNVLTLFFRCKNLDGIIRKKEGISRKKYGILPNSEWDETPNYRLTSYEKLTILLVNVRAREHVGDVSNMRLWLELRWSSFNCKLR